MSIVSKMIGDKRESPGHKVLDSEKTISIEII